MKLRTWVLSLMLLVSTAAWTHAALEESSPADKSRITAPAKIGLRFSDSVQLTALTLQHGKESAKALKVPLQSDFGFTIPLPALAPGDYVIGWSAVSDDTHVSRGKIHFTVVATEGRADKH